MNSAQKEQNAFDQDSAHWPNVLRVVWITGGVFASSEPMRSNVEVKAGTNGPTIRSLKISSYSSLFRVLQIEGLQVIGMNFVEEPNKFPRLRHPEFRTFVRSVGWLPYEVRQKWRQIAVAAGREGKMDLMDIASRVASGLRYAESRLGDLARAYSFQLGARTHQNQSVGYQAFQDANGFQVYKSIHALFWELAVLRDALAQFLGTFRFSLPKVRSMKTLRIELRSVARGDTVADEVLHITDQKLGGWLGKFTAYRNCFTHVAPLEHIEGPFFVVQDMRKLPAFDMPQIYYPLPADIKDLSDKRSGGLPFQSLHDLHRLLARPRSRAVQPDALEYLHQSVIRFAELSNTLVALSPTPPKPIQILPDDLIDVPRKKACHE